MSTPENKGFLSAGISALSPWTSRSTTPKPTQTPDNESVVVAGAPAPQRGGDHTVNRKSRLSLRKFPPDCPPLVVRWFHAVDAPKRKPFSSTVPKPSDKPLPRPKKWIPFSQNDSRAIEAAYQKLADEDEASERRREASGGQAMEGNAGLDKAKSTDETVKVPVNEDYLFDVDVENRELAPAYWNGPVYDVQRGTWFTSDGELVDENLAAQLEEGYLKIKPWRFPKPEQNPTPQPRSRPVSLNMKAVEDQKPVQKNADSKSNPVTPKASFDDLRNPSNQPVPDFKAPISSTDEYPRTHRLFGAYMNSVVTYQDERIAWRLTDDFLSRMGSTLYSRFMGDGHFAGSKYIRGFIDPSLKKSGKDSKDEKDTKESERPVTPGLAYGDHHITDSSGSDAPGSPDGELEAPADARRRTLERHMSSIILSTEPDTDKQEEEIRKRDEQEMREDYKDQNKDEQGREIEHLLLVTHGIGQRLGIRMESVNFIHDVNTLRKSLKAVYANSTDLQALNAEVDSDIKNSRVQVLPICWRHHLDFPKQSLQHNRREHDLGDADFDDSEYPSLEDITVEGVPAVRNLLTDLALDILLYQSPVYKGHISRIVVRECNHIFKLFMERNPGFKGKVSLVGHSLGSAIMFDILCHQKDDRLNPHSSKQQRAIVDDLKLDFEVEDFYALGSPIGLFQMLKGRTIAARPPFPFIPTETPAEDVEDPFSPAGQTTAAAEKAFDLTTSSPKCKQIFNIFHPTDPISYRLEPLISPAMSSLKPQPLPYTKKGIFGAPAAQGLTGIGARVGQGVSGLWTSVSAGIASGILNRSLGITGTEATKLSSDLKHGENPARPLSVGAGTNLTAGVLSPSRTPDGPEAAAMTEETKRRLNRGLITPGEEGEHPPTLIDSELETLYSGFEKGRKSHTSEDGRNIEKDLEWQELEERSRKLKREEAKLRALNANGRVDYSIQEGAFDISLLASIASHLSYWSDEDVSHFLISQLLARHRVFLK